MALTVTDILKFRDNQAHPWQNLLIEANINFNLIYPVGSIYMSTVNVSPATLFGGTWEQLEDRFLLGAGQTYTAGDTGGEAEHTLITDEMPAHTHGVLINTTNSEAAGYGLTQAGPFQNRPIISRNSADIITTSTGGGQAHNNMPPYLVVYMWRRLTLSPALTPLPLNVLGDVASEDIVPIDKGGTGADNTSDALVNLGVPMGTTKINLLWTNSAPTNFSAQTISLDLSQYDMVKIVCSPWGSNNEWYTTDIFVGTDSRLMFLKILDTQYNDQTGTAQVINGTDRAVSVSTTGVTFGTGQMIYDGRFYKNWDSRAIPVKIYGVKF